MASQIGKFSILNPAGRGPPSRQYQWRFRLQTSRCAFGLSGSLMWKALSTRELDPGSNSPDHSPTCLCQTQSSQTDSSAQCSAISSKAKISTATSYEQTFNMQISPERIVAILAVSPNDYHNKYLTKTKSLGSSHETGLGGGSTSRNMRT